MTRCAVVIGRRMRRPLALGDRVVMAAHAAAQDLRVVDMHGGAKRYGVVASRAVVGTGDMRLRLGHRIVDRIRAVADSAVARSALEDGIEVTGLARKVPVHTVQLKTGRLVIEGERDRRGSPQRQRRRLRQALRTQQH